MLRSCPPPYLCLLPVAVWPRRCLHPPASVLFALFEQHCPNPPLFTSRRRACECYAGCRWPAGGAHPTQEMLARRRACKCYKQLHALLLSKPGFDTQSVFDRVGPAGRHAARRQASAAAASRSLRPAPPTDPATAIVVAPISWPLTIQADSQTGESVEATVLCYFCSRAPGPTPATGCLGPPSSPRSGWPWLALPTPAQTSALPDRATVTAAGSRAASLLTPDKILGQWLSRYFGEQPAAGSRAASLPGPRPSAGLKLGTSPRAQNWQSRCQVGTFRRRLAGSGPAGSTGKQARTVALIHGR